MPKSARCITVPVFYELTTNGLHYISSLRRDLFMDYAGIIRRDGLYIAHLVYAQFAGHTSGRFVKQEQWEHWRAKRILVSGSKHRGACGSPGV